jgi:uncharacterized repeat protein (TIGR01451 family)
MTLLVLLLVLLGAMVGPVQAAHETGPALLGPASARNPAESSSLEALADQQQPLTPTRKVRTPPVRTRPSPGDGSKPYASGSVVVSKQSQAGGPSATEVYNGDRITYTITITNNGALPAEKVDLFDTLPDGVDEVSCADECNQVIQAQLIQNPLGAPVIVSRTVEVNWRLGTLPPDPPNNVAQRQFSVRVIGRSDGTVVRNTADISYTGGVAVSNETQSIVRVKVDDQGSAALADVPTWLSSDLGGTISLDWGDFDRDGYLDLALGSTVGTTIYRYDHETGRLVSFWGNALYALGVRWADLDTDGYLELVTVGDSVSHSPMLTGTNRIFDYDLISSEFTTYTFASDFQLLRVEPGDYDGDDDIDLIASTNAISTECPVRLLVNPGDGVFADSSPGSGDPECVSVEPAAALAAGDHDNDGDLDLALGAFPNATRLLKNSGTGTNPFNEAVEILPATVFLPYDFAWGDYDRDGYLDLAAAFPLDKKVRIYHNDGGTGFSYIPGLEFQSKSFRAPQAVDWGDFNGDGYPDLFVADAPPIIYLNTGGSFSRDSAHALPESAVAGQIWALAAADQDNDGDLDLALGNREGASLLFTAFAPFLDATLDGIGSWQATSVAWGEVVGHDGYLDLLYGSGADRDSYAVVFGNQAGDFSSPADITLGESRFGPHSVAWGDVDGDHRLDIALGNSMATQEQNRLYLATDKDDPWPPSDLWVPETLLLSYGVAWGDADGDRDLDLLIVNDGHNELYVNQDGMLATTPAWLSVEANDTRSVAWGDYNHDGYLDFAAGNYGQPNELYCNNGDNTFTLVWTSADSSDTMSVAWADYDGDGDLDLAAGNDGQSNLIYENHTCQNEVCGDLPFPKNPCQRPDSALSEIPIWGSDEIRKTTSLAWGDWDNDGDLDLAVGNDGEPDQVYTNQGSVPGSPRLLWLWSSAESFHTSGVAWGDGDNDGDLDLAISQKGKSSGQNGVYANNYALAAHLPPLSASMTPLPINPAYLVITQPGTTDTAYFYSSDELLAYLPMPPDVPITFRMYDPNVPRDGSVPTDGFTFPFSYTLAFEYSLDGGGTWQEATGVLTAQNPVTMPNRLGGEATFLWNAQADQAISDDVRFRVSVIHQDLTGPVQRASASATSPPFRVRATTCVWPTGPSISVDPAHPDPGQEVIFEGAVLEGSHELTFTWDFGDGSPPQNGQLVRHEYAWSGVYEVKMGVTSQPCPVVRVVTTTHTVVVGTGFRPIFLPIVMRRATHDNTASMATIPASPLPENSLGERLPQGGGAGELNKMEEQEPVSDDQSPGVQAAQALVGDGQSPDGRAVPELVESGDLFPPGVTIGPSAPPITITADRPGIHSQPSINQDGRFVAFWSTGNLAPDPCTQRPLSEIGTILLVDDDYNYPDVRPYYADVLNQLGITFDEWDTLLQGEPEAAELAPYAGVIWFSGVAYCGPLNPCAGPSDETENALSSFLEDGKFLFISSQDYLYDRGLSTFMTTHLGVVSYQDDVGQAQVAGSGSVFGGLDLYALSYPFTNYSDRISPDGSAELAFTGNWGDAAVNKDGGHYRTTFWGFPFEALPSAAGRRAAMETALYWLGLDCKFTGLNDDGNIEVFVAHVSPGGNFTATVAYTEATFSSGSILGGFNLWPSISADGNRIAFFSDSNLEGHNGDTNFEIFVYDSALDEILQITHSEGGANLWPSISADGSRIAFSSDRDLDPYGENSDGNQEIFVYDSALDDILQITDTSEGSNDQPAISGDGDRIAFSSDRDLEGNGKNADGNQEIFVYDNTLDDLRQITDSEGGANLWPSISADGSRIAFSSDRDLDPYGENADGNREIFLADIDPGPDVEFTQITSSTLRTNEQPSISADGTRIGFVSDAEVWLYDHPARRGISPSVAGTIGSRPSVSADGMYMAYMMDGQIFWLDNSIVDLAVSKSSAPDPVESGEQVTYTIVVENRGTIDVDGAVVSDDISDKIKSFSWTCEASQGGACTPGPVQDQDINDTVVISAGYAITYTVEGRVKPKARGPLLNTAAVSVPPPLTDQMPDNNTDTITDSLLPLADLAVVKTVDVTHPNELDSITYVIALTNDNPSAPADALDVVLTDMLPEHITYLSDDPTKGSYDSASGVWDIGDLDWGSSETLAITARVEPAAGGMTITNTIDGLTGDWEDPYTDNNTDTVAIHVNDSPHAVGDLASVDEGGEVPIDVLANDYDLDGQIVPASLAIVITPTYGEVTTDTSGVVTYTQTMTPLASEDVFEYTVRDDDNASDTAWVTITITSVKNAPIAVDDAYTMSEDRSLDVPPEDGVLANDIDVDDDPLTAILESAAVPGELEFHEDGSFVYTPPLGYTGTVTFTYGASDGQLRSNTAVVTIAVETGNNPPVANDDSASTPEDTAVLIDAAANDSDVDGNLDPASAAVTSGPSGGAITNHGDGTFTYTPDADFQGSDSFVYQICDTDGACDAAVVSIDVQAVNEAPVAAVDSYSTGQEATLSVAAPGVLGNDADPDGDALAANLVSGPAHGALTLNADGSFSYNPDGEYSGLDSFSYEACDPGQLCDGATVTIDVLAVNEPPVAVDDSYSTDEDTVLPGENVMADNGNGRDLDMDGDSLTVTEINGQWFTPGVTLSLPSGALLTIVADGTFTYDPHGQFDYLGPSDTGNDSFTYTISDGALTDTATVTITISGINDPPHAVDDSGARFTGDEDTPFTTGNVLYNDTDPENDPLRVVSFDTTNTLGLVSHNGDGTFTYDPNGQFEHLEQGEEDTDLFTYTVDDGYRDTDTATVVITVTGVKDPRVVDLDGLPPSIDGSTTVLSDTPGSWVTLVSSSPIVTAVDDARLVTATVTIQRYKGYEELRVNLHPSRDWIFGLTQIALLAFVFAWVV